MIEVKIPADIHSYKSKLAFGFSTRQIISIAAASAIAIPMVLKGKQYFSEDVVGWTVIVTAVPIIAWGFFTYKDMKFEEFIRRYISFNWYSQKRVYEDTELNIFYRINEEINELNVIEQKLDTGEFSTKTIWRDDI